FADWLAHHAQARRITWQRLTSGRFEQELRELLARPPAPAVAPSGNHEAARLVARLLAGEPLRGACQRR
ncbi:MAG: hypothetical protein WD928_12480, partial [Gammaproteobacteria bacterium]